VQVTKKFKFCECGHCSFLKVPRGILDGNNLAGNICLEIIWQEKFWWEKFWHEKIWREKIWHEKILA
jgi:hypothetical protein